MPPRTSIPPMLDITTLGIPRPTELGQMLGLSMDGAPATVPQDAEQVSLKVRKALELLFSKPLTSTEERAWMEKFNSLYLPSLVRTALDEESGISEVVVLLIEAAFIDAHRFARVQPDLTPPLYERLVHQSLVRARRLDDHKIMSTKDGALRTRRHVGHYFMALSSVLVEVINYLPETVTIQPLPVAVRSELRYLCDRYDRDPLLRAELRYPFGEAVSDQKLVSAQGDVRDVAFLEAPWPGMTGARDNRQFGAIAWWSCQVIIEHPVIEPCALFTDGKEMMACSRCGAVRYCSKYHQTRDWPWHKQFCFRPTW